MTIGELRTMLADMPPGGEFGITNEMYAMLFPPGKPDMNAKVHYVDFAKIVGCRVTNSTDGKEVVFVKDAAGQAGHWNQGQHTSATGQKQSSVLVSSHRSFGPMTDTLLVLSGAASHQFYRYLRPNQAISE